MTYPVLSDFKDYLKVTSSSEDTLLTNILDAAQQTWERETGRVFVAATATRLFPAVSPYVSYRGKRLNLFDDLVSVTAVTNGNGDVIDVADYRLLPPIGAPYHAIEIYAQAAPRFVDGTANGISVEGSWGFTSACPPDVWLGILELAAFRYRARSSGGATRDSTAQAGRVRESSDLPQHLRELMASYSRYVV